MMLEQRTQDLRTAENVAMQSIPMIKTMQFSNMNLVRKINSAFIITPAGVQAGADPGHHASSASGCRRRP